MNRVYGPRALVFIAAAVLHGVLIFCLAFKIPRPPQAASETAAVIKLADLEEERPPLPPRPPSPPPPAEPPRNAVEAIAEQFEETETAPVETAAPVPQAAPVPRAAAGEEFLPMHLVSERPVFNEDEIARAVIYPPIAKRSGIGGRVILELFIDREGWVRQVVILGENPPGRGFGEAAARAFRGIRCVPARANGEKVSVRLRYPVSFVLN
ncbi:MAG: energy transducer TonB [Treponema sp.]|jgi:protein TonB|nr:energy transducer TonB [Treponema sp.]